MRRFLKPVPKQGSIKRRLQTHRNKAEPFRSDSKVRWFGLVYRYSKRVLELLAEGFRLSAAVRLVYGTFLKHIGDEHLTHGLPLQKRDDLVVGRADAIHDAHFALFAAADETAFLARDLLLADEERIKFIDHVLDLTRE